MPEKLAQMKEIYLIEATKNKGLPTGKVGIEVETAYVEEKPTGPLKVPFKFNGTIEQVHVEYL